MDFFQYAVDGNELDTWVQTAVQVSLASILLGLLVALVTQALMDLFLRHQLLKRLTLRILNQRFDAGSILLRRAVRSRFQRGSEAEDVDLEDQNAELAEAARLLLDSSTWSSTKEELESGVFNLGPEQISAKYDVMFRSAIERDDISRNLLLGMIVLGQPHRAHLNVTNDFVDWHHPKMAGRSDHDKDELYQSLAGALEVSIDEFQARLSSGWVRWQYTVSLIISAVMIVALYFGPTAIDEDFEGWLIAVFLLFISGFIAFAFRLLFARVFRGVTA